MAKRITTNLLVEVGACSEQRELFAELFPDGTEVTEELCIRYTKQFDFDWAARYLLPKEAWQEYLRTRSEAWAKCQRIRNKALAEYERIRDEAWEKYARTRSEAWEEYERITEKALAEYGRIAEKEWTEFCRICATEFARLWNKYMP